MLFRSHDFAHPRGGNFKQLADGRTVFELYRRSRVNPRPARRKHGYIYRFVAGGFFGRARSNARRRSAVVFHNTHNRGAHKQSVKICGRTQRSERHSTRNNRAYRRHGDNHVHDTDFRIYFRRRRTFVQLEGFGYLCNNSIRRHRLAHMAQKDLLSHSPHHNFGRFRHSNQRSCMIFPAIAYAQSKHINNPQKISAARKSGGGNFGGTESRKNAHRIISDKQNGILLPSRFAAIRLSAIRQTISRKPGLMPCRWLAPCKRLSLRLYRSALTAVLLVPYLAAKRHICFCFRR